MEKKAANTTTSRSTDKVAEATLGLKSLQLGSAPTPTKQSNGNNTGNSSGSSKGKKSKKNATNNNNNNNKSVSAPPKKMGPILLGMPDSPMESQDDTDPFCTKIGGVPLWLEKNVPAPSKFGICESCGKNMYLLLQAYVPLEKSAYDRVVYVWACNQRLCMRNKGSFRVVRALKLNQEYAQKLEKKAKPATTMAAKPAIAGPAANPFGGPSTFDMGNALFGGAGSGFNNPFAPPPSSSNPFAPPAGFGAPTAPKQEALTSFASVASSNIPAKEESESESESEEAPEESTEWPEKLQSFSPHYLYITEEVLEDSDSDDEIAQRYSHFMALENDVAEEGEGGASWGGETYEKQNLPKGVDKAFQKFTERVQSWPDQCVRYDFPGLPLLFNYSDRAAQVLLPPNTQQHSKHTTPSTHRIPRCPACGGPRGFELQLMPNLLSLLAVTSQKYLSVEEKESLKKRKGADQFNIGMEWGTILIYSCVGDCFGKPKKDEDGNKVKYFEEVALVQFED